jgi:hypothetical protein
MEGKVCKTGREKKWVDFTRRKIKEKNKWGSCGD